MSASGLDHPSDQTLRAYGVGKLYGNLADSVHSHLDVCGDCRQRVAELSDDTFLGRLRDAQARPQSPAPAGFSFAGVSGASADPVGSIPQDLADHPDYEILGELGRGGMGVVYLAENKLMARKEVLKVVSRELMDRRGVLERFLREIRSAAQLHHPNIVGAYAAFRAGQSIVFAMEYVEGQDLARYVKTQGPLPVPHAAYFIAQAALGLQYAHEKGLVHRDIKPSNLILAKQQRRAVVKVLDFGLAKATREGPVEKGLTHEGQMLGTPDYIAPEQSLDATKADIRADIYSLGCTLHYLLAGSPPFQGTSLYEVLQAHHSMEAKPLNMVRSDVPWELAVVVAKMMAKDPARRYQNPGEVAQALKPFYKPGESEPAAGKAELSQAGQTLARTAPGAAAKLPPLPPAPVEQVKPAAPVSIWQSLVGLDQAKRKSVRLGDAAPLRLWPPPPWIWPVVLGALVLGLLIWWAPAVLTLKTQDGVIVVENVPGNATAFKEPAATQPPALPAPAAPAAGAPSPIAGPERVAQASAARAPAAPAPPRPPEQLTSKTTGMKLLRIEGGEFMMGSPDDDKEAQRDEKPQHKVQVSPFYLGVTEVTQEQFQNVTGNNPSWFSSTGASKEQVAGRDTGRLPVEFVSWFDAVGYCNALSDKDRLTAYYEIAGADVQVPDPNGSGYRLPTEAEWEYACRAGTTMKFSFGDDPSNLGQYAWYSDNSSSMPHPVGLKRPNAFGLYDMDGNVWEWCQDWYAKDYYQRSPVDDPVCRRGDSLRVLRGGSLNFNPRECRSAARGRDDPHFGYSNRGFRLARSRPFDLDDRSAGMPAAPPPASADTPHSVALNSPSRAPTNVAGSPLPSATWISPSTNMAFVRIKGGEFMMGSPDDDKEARNDEKPQHKVRISPFYLGVTEVTQEQYHKLTGNNPSWFSSNGGGRRVVAGRSTGRLPVEQVSWFDAVRYCNALSDKDALTAYYEIASGYVRVHDPNGSGYRLPTEAEWEYACRAGTKPKFSFGDDPSMLGECAWYCENSRGMTHAVRLKRPNAFGLYDMHGNVLEWCEDWFADDYYKRSPVTDPVCSTEAAARVIRGGSWDSVPLFCRSAIRIRVAPAIRRSLLGFRVARGQSGR